MSEYDNEEIEIYIPTDQELWETYPEAKGVDRADILLQLSMSYCPEREGQPAITMAEMAMEIYKEVGLSEEISNDFAFAYVVIAENKAKIGDLSGAIEAAERAIPLVELHKLQNFESLPWNLLRWYVISGREIEAKGYLQKLLIESAELAHWSS